MWLNSSSIITTISYTLDFHTALMLTLIPWLSVIRAYTLLYTLFLDVLTRLWVHAPACDLPPARPQVRQGGHRPAQGPTASQAGRPLSRVRRPWPLLRLRFQLRLQPMSRPPSRPSTTILGTSLVWLQPDKDMSPELDRCQVNRCHGKAS